MMKKKLITIVLFIYGTVGVMLAAEVINVDLNGYNDDTPYIGNGAYDVGDDAVWTAFYGGFGVPVSSERAEGIVTEAQAFYSSVYAAQVWLGDSGQDHYYQWGSALMDDGFTANESAEPNIPIFGQGAYQGVYDIYVYGNDAGTFTLSYYGAETAQTVTGDANEGQFELGHNYVIFEDVDINNANPGDVYLSYTGTLNALQFVKQKLPVAVQDGTIINASSYDVAGERNVRSDDPQGFGPDIFGGSVGYLEILEFMGYDITVDDANQGEYNLAIDVNTAGEYPCYGLKIYLDDEFLGNVSYKKVSPPAGETTTVKANLLAGGHTVKWLFPTTSSASTGFNITSFDFHRIGDVNMVDCNDINFYGLTYGADLSGNCIVGLEDLSAQMDNWLNCNNPDPNECL